MHYKNLLYITLFLLAACKTSNKPQKEVELISTAGQTNLMPRYETDLRKEKLNGPVKEYWNFKNYDKNLTKKQIRFYYVLDMLDVFSFNGHYSYDKNGIQETREFLKDSISYQKLFTINGITKKKKNIYKYDLTTFNKIKDYQQTKIPATIYNPYRLKLDRFNYHNYVYEVKKDSSFKALQYGYKYTFDTHKKILTEIAYIKWNRDLDNIIDKETVEYTVYYKYNNKNQLVAKEYVFVKDPYDTVTNSLDHDVQISTHYTPIEEYTYNEAGNLTTVYLYGTKSKEFILYSADYFYNENNELVKLRERKSDSQAFGFPEYRVTHDFYYNKNGEITKINTYDTDETTIHATFLFEYKKHDKYNNWLQCNMYLDSKKTETPTAVMERIIEYYKE